jgi:hypothetical protein
MFAGVQTEFLRHQLGDLRQKFVAGVIEGSMPILRDVTT